MKADAIRTLREVAIKVVGWMKTHLRIGLNAPTSKPTGVSGSASLGAVSALPVSGTMVEPDYTAGVDFLMRDDQFQSYASLTDVTNATYHLLQDAGVVTFQTTGGRSGYPKVLKQSWSEVRTSLSDGVTVPVGTTGVWTCSRDAACGVEGGPLTTQADDDAGGKAFIFEWYKAFDPGYQWEWYTPAVPSPTCTRGLATKEYLIFRQSFGGSEGRWGCYAESNSAFSYSSLYPVGSTDNLKVHWEMHCGPTTTVQNQFPSPGGNAVYVQHLNNALNGVDKSPAAIADGAVHRFRMKYRNESVLDAGDGFCGLWVDGYPVIYLDGLDSTSFLFGKVYTRQGTGLGAKTTQIAPTMNAGSPYNQTCYFNGHRTWRVGG